MVTRTLVTTAEEQTWPISKDVPVLFLGEWCKRYNRKKKWEKLNSKVAIFHWDDRKKLYEDYQYIDTLYESLLAELSQKLNQIHSTEYSLRYWRIIVGPWLGFFIQMLFDRWSMLSESIEKKECKNCIILERDPIMAIPNSMEHFLKLCIADFWNEAIYGELLEKYFSKLIKIEKITPLNKNKNENNNQQIGWMDELKQKLKKFVFRVSEIFPNECDYFFISSYLPLKFDLLLQVRLRQFPRMWRAKKIPLLKPDMKKRQWQLDCNEINISSFEVVVRNLIPLHIPTCYLEGYDPLVKILDLMPWPKNPKLIFTSNSFISDDIFKAWAAKKVEKNIPLVIGQHGGNFGMNPFSFQEEHQIKIATKWLSWGWSDFSRPKITPIAMLKNLEISVTYNPNGGALMVEMTSPRYSYHLYAGPIAGQWIEYFDDQNIFLNALPDRLREKVVLRLDHNDYGWDQNNRWKEKMPEINIDSSNLSISKLVEKNRLYISTYNATTYLESLTWNIPTIIFWSPKYWEIKDNVKPYFELLQSVGIFHETPESAAKQMIMVWDNISDWWESDEVQSARKIFCNQFALIPSKPMSGLESLIEDIANTSDVSSTT